MTMRTRKKIDYATNVLQAAKGVPSPDSEEMCVLLGKTETEFAESTEYVRGLLFQQAIIGELTTIRELLARLVDKPGA